MKTIIFLVIVSIASIYFLPNNDFKTSQLKYIRVKTAYKEKEEYILNTLKKNSISKPQIFLRVFKREQILEVWAKNNSEKEFKKILEYPFCSTSGKLGPKRKEGDYQIPEGFYYINRFNPQSNFYLSLGINYPNESDKILSDKKNPGGDVFIHGGCATIGCIPITDEKIKELYVLSVEARSNGQIKIPVHIFPYKLTKNNFDKLKSEFQYDKQLILFWENLKIGFDYFENKKSLPEINVSTDGKYIIK
jgi:murein L,D-transpeptidase YafK